MQKQKEAKTFARFALRADYFALDSAIRRIYNRSNGGVALHEVLPLATEIRLESIDKQGAKLRVNCIPRTNCPH